MSKEIEDLIFSEDLKYTKDHEWAKIEGDNIRVGLDDYAQDQLGDIVFVELPEKGSRFETGEVFATVESVKAVSDCFIPIGGEIVSTNIKLEDDPALVNSDPYNNGWFVIIIPDDMSEIKNLMDSFTARNSLIGE